MWQAALKNFQPGDEYTLVDEFARVLKLDDWFEWGADYAELGQELATALHEKSDQAPEGTTNPELLKQKEQATAMYLLGVLERFEKLTDDQIKQIGLEIGIRGINGIDYASLESQYTLKAFPGETFNGLQMLCLMYVAFQHIDPSADIGADLRDAYQMALKMFKRGAD